MGTTLKEWGAAGEKWRIDCSCYKSKIYFVLRRLSITKCERAWLQVSWDGEYLTWSKDYLRNVEVVIKYNYRTPLDTIDIKAKKAINRLIRVVNDYKFRKEVEKEIIHHIKSVIIEQG